MQPLYSNRCSDSSPCRQSFTRTQSRCTHPASTIPCFNYPHPQSHLHPHRASPLSRPYLVNHLHLPSLTAPSLHPSIPLQIPISKYPVQPPSPPYPKITFRRNVGYGLTCGGRVQNASMGVVVTLRLWLGAGVRSRLGVLYRPCWGAGVLGV